VGILRESNIQPNLLQLGTESIPRDCRLLIIAGPVNRIPRNELDEIDAYLKRGGRVLVMLGYHSIDHRGIELSDLDLLLDDWGVNVGRGNVVDTRNGRSNSREDVLVMEYGTHPIVNPLRGKCFRTAADKCRCLFHQSWQRRSISWRQARLFAGRGRGKRKFAGNFGQRNSSFGGPG
jgi:hypothetical protein